MLSTLSVGAYTEKRTETIHFHLPQMFLIRLASQHALDRHRPPAAPMPLPPQLRARPISSACFAVSTTTEKALPLLLHELRMALGPYLILLSAPSPQG